MLPKPNLTVLLSAVCTKLPFSSGLNFLISPCSLDETTFHCHIFPWQTAEERLIRKGLSGKQINVHPEAGDDRDSEDFFNPMTVCEI